MSPARPAIASAIALPPGAVFEVVLEDVSVADAPATELGRATVADPGNPPFEFEIAFDPASIEPDRAYSVRAQVSVGRRLIFVSDTMNPVLTHGAPDEVRGLDDQGRRHQPRRRARPRRPSARTGCGCRRASSGELPCAGLRGAALPAEPLAGPGLPPAPDLEGQGRDAATRSAAGRSIPDQRMLTLRGAEEELELADPRAGPAAA